MKLSMEVLMAWKTAAEIFKSGDVIDIEHELKDEVQFLPESNESLTTKLKKKLNANVELVSILQEMEKNNRISENRNL
jgi:hypothetical protein